MCSPSRQSSITISDHVRETESVKKKYKRTRARPCYPWKLSVAVVFVYVRDCERDHLHLHIYLHCVKLHDTKKNAIHLKTKNIVIGFLYVTRTVSSTIGVELE